MMQSFEGAWNDLMSTRSLPARFASTGVQLWIGRNVTAINPYALAEYGKIAAIGMFVGVPLAAVAGYMFGARKRVRANGRQRR